MVVRNGKSHHERTVNLGAGPVRFRAPRMNDRRPKHRFTSKILPPCERPSPRLEEVLPTFDLRRLSTGDSSETLKVLLEPEATGFVATTMPRLPKTGQEDHQVWRKRSLKGKDYVYFGADAITFNVRLQGDHQACLLMVGVLPDGRNAVAALEADYRESTESWASMLQDLRRRGLTGPVLAVGDGSPDFWAALGEVRTETEEERCWKHNRGSGRLANVLDKLPKRPQTRAKEMLHEIMHGPNRESAQEEIALFPEECGAHYPKSVKTLTKDQDQLLAFFDLPTGHWIYLRTTNPITWTLEARTKKTRGAGSLKAGLAIAFKLLLPAEKRWRGFSAPHLVAWVKAGVKFPDAEAEMFQPESAPADLCAHTPLMFAASEASIHEIRGCLDCLGFHLSERMSMFKVATSRTRIAPDTEVEEHA